MPVPSNPKPCTECTLTFSKLEELRKHMRTIHPVLFSCTLCNLTFPTNKAFRRHKREAHQLPATCLLCKNIFIRKSACLAHQRDVHPQCKHCKERFPRLEDLRAHQLGTGHLHCQECDIYFQKSSSYKAHVRSIQHTIQYHCCDCDREYTDQEQLNNHCCLCDTGFVSQAGLSKHLKSASHRRNVENLESQPESSLPYKCGSCSKAFQSEKALKRHTSKSHKPARNIKCPVGRKCIKKFATPSALLNHLESGSCHSGMNRAKMAELVFAHDPNRYITSIDTGHMPVQKPDNNQFSSPMAAIIASPRSLPLGGVTLPPLNTDLDDDDNISEWSFADGAILTPATSEWSLIRSDGVLLTPAIGSDDGSEWSFTSGNFVATPLSNMSVSEYNNIAASVSETRLVHNNLRCNLCPPERKPFSSAKALQAHFDSAAHAPKMYHCPLSFMPNVRAEDLLKRRSFSTLGGLTQHLETGGCEGGVELYKRAISFVEEQLESLGLGGIRLLSV